MSKKTDVIYNLPAEVELVEGQEYHHCTCNLSQNMPFCDGAHVGTDFVPIAFTAKKSGKVYLCQCQKSEELPYCDGTHKGCS